MNILTTCIFWLIFGLITFGHIWLFRRVYNSPFDDGQNSRPLENVAVAGMTAGAVANYFGSLILTICVNPYSIFFFLYGLALTIPIGIFFTVLFWKLNKKLELKVGFCGRAILGLFIGAFVGIAISCWLISDSIKVDNYSFPLTKSALAQRELAYFIFFSLTASFSAIMAKWKNNND